MMIHAPQPGENVKIGPVQAIYFNFISLFHIKYLFSFKIFLFQQLSIYLIVMLLLYTYLFSLSIMTVQCEDGREPKSVMKDVLKACKKIEPDCIFYSAGLFRRIFHQIRTVCTIYFNFISLFHIKYLFSFEDGREPKSVMKDVLKACKKIEPDCEIEF